jgi:SAM-dependent methyltransferase
MQELTTKEYWDARWEKVKLPVAVNKSDTRFVTRELIRLFDHHLPHREGLSILEIGGAPGKWLAYFKKYFHYDIHALDYSEAGCQKIKENFDLLHLNVSIYRKNILTDDLSDVPRCDIVCSFGFIEHFSDLNLIIEKHLDLLKQDGILVLGVPNFLGITERVLQRTAPRMLTTHNLQAMDIKTWKRFEDKYQLKSLFKGYIGGFDLHNCRRCELRTPLNRLIRIFFKTLIRVTRKIPPLRKCNTRYWSPYVLLVYKKG